MEKRRRTLLLILAYVLVSDTNAQERREMLVENVHLLTMMSDSIQAHSDVLISDGAIVQISEHPMSGVSETAIRVDGTDKFLMPGLIDSHIHIWEDADARVNDKYAAQRLLVNGVTRARVAFGEPEILQWRDAVESGEAPGARLVVASPYITTNIETEDFILSNPSATEARDTIRQFAEDGYDYVKVVQVPDQATLNAILIESEAQRLPVLGHYPNPQLSLESVVTGSWVSIEHFDIVVDLFRKKQGSSYNVGKLVDHLKSRNAAITSVGLFFEDDIVFDSDIGKDLREFVALGGTLLAGTEGNFGPGGLGNTLHVELEKLQSVGLSTFEVIRTATVNAGPYVEKGDKVGVIDVGYSADLILLSANPLDDLSALRSLVGVVVSGRWYDEKELSEIQKDLPEISRND